MEQRIRWIELRDFCSFDHVRFDLTEGMAGAARNLAMVFGENGSGKSNLIDSVAFLKMTTDTLLLREASGTEWKGPETHMGELDAEKGRTFEFRVPIPVPGIPLWDIRSLADRFRSVWSSSGPCMELGFSVDGHEGVYRLSLGDDGRVCEESLFFRISSRSGTIFSLSRSGGGVMEEFSNSLFANALQRRHFKSRIAGEWGDHTFLAILKDDVVRNGPPEGMGTGILDALAFIDGIIVRSRETGFVSDGLDSVLRNVMGGSVPSSMGRRIEEVGICLHYLLWNLVSDIRDVRYEISESEGAIDYSLIIRRMIAGREVELPMSAESDGILRIVDMFPALYMCSKGSVVLIDDVGSNIHSCMTPEIIRGEMRGGKGQMIVTTHCTSILEDADPRCCYVVQVDVDGYKRVVSFPKVARTVEGHNNRLRFEGGTFEGRPCMGYIDIANYVDIAEEGRQNL